MSAIPVGRNLTELLELLKFGEQYPDLPQNFIPPSLTDPNYVPPTKGPRIIAVAVVTMVIATFMSVSRLVVRKFRGPMRWGLDDWFIIPVTLLVIATSIPQILIVKYGCVGHHLWDCTFTEIKYSYRFRFINLVLGFATATSIRIAVVLFLWRLSVPVNVVFRRKLISTVILFLVVLIGAIVMMVFICSPVSAQWNLNVRLFSKSHCRWEWQLPTAWIAILGISDFWLLSLPVELIWTLQRPKRVRIGVTFLFLLGSVASIIALVKLKWMKGAYYSFDPTWNSEKLIVLTQIEQTFGLCVVSLPALNFLFVKVIPNWMQKPSTTQLSRMTRMSWMPGIASSTDRSSDGRQAFVVNRTVELSVGAASKAGVAIDTTPASDWTTTRTETSAPSCNLRSRRSSYAEDDASFELVFQEPER